MGSHEHHPEDFAWGDTPRLDGRLMAHAWDGPEFPWRSTGESGSARTAGGRVCGRLLPAVPASRSPAQMLDTGMSHLA